MIFSIPRSRSYMDNYSYQKTKNLGQVKSFLLDKNKSFCLNGEISMKGKKQPLYLLLQFKQKDKKKTFKGSRGRSKQFIYNDKKSMSEDKYFLQNKMIPFTAYKSVKINKKMVPLTQKSQEKLNISFGKKLVDPIHQKFNYFIKNTKQQTSPFAISDFLLQPCKIKAKKLQKRLTTSENFLPVHSQNITQRKIIESRNKTHSSFQKKAYNTSRTANKNQYHKKNHKIFMEFSKQLYDTKNLKEKSKNFHVDPWQFDPLSQNMESIKIN